MTEPAPDFFSDEQEPRPRTQRRKRRSRRVLVIVLSTLLVLLLGAGGAAWWFVNRLSSNIERIPDAFPSDEGRPADVDDGSVTFLLGGLDGADKVDATGRGAARTDTIMLVHIPEGRESAYLVSIPRDTWVEIPGEGENKINAAYSFGGTQLFVSTIEQITGIHVDHLAIIDWNGFEALTDALGGVPLHFDEPVQLADDTELPAGDHVLNGEQALQYVRERKGLPGGDFDRVKRQQNYLRGLMNQMLSSGTLTDIGTVNEVTGAVGEAARVDDQLSATGMAQLGFSMRGLRSNNVTFLTVPTNGTGTSDDGQSIVIYDAERAGQLWAALQGGTMDTFLADNPDLVTGEQVN